MIQEERAEPMCHAADEADVRNHAKQARHYDRIAVRYDMHYNDSMSERYRNEFIHKYLFRGIELDGMKCLDAACGAGAVSQYMLSKRADVVGLDVSEEMLGLYKARVKGCQTVKASIVQSGLESESFDRVVIVGGLHHVHPHVDEAVDEMYRILRPGGYLCFMEPHAGSLADHARKLWYRCDSSFEKNEASIDVDRLMARNADRFHYLQIKYGGNVAYMLVLNSGILRIPAIMKKAYAPLLVLVEEIIAPLIDKKSISCFCISRWRKK